MGSARFRLSAPLALAIAAAPALAETAAERCAKTAKDGEVAACQQALLEKAGDLEIRRHLAQAYLASNDALSAYRIYDEIRQQRPDDAKAQFDYAAALATFHDFELAAEPIRAAMRLAPDNLTTLQLAAIIFGQVRRYDEAFAAVGRAAELGDTVQMFALARYYEQGIGVTSDPKAARDWYERAAAAGHIGAMMALADVYAEGRLGVRPDLDRAEAWATRARREGYQP